VPTAGVTVAPLASLLPGMTGVAPVAEDERVGGRHEEGAAGAAAADAADAAAGAGALFTG
jgi:uncharacterized membrane protein